MKNELELLKREIENKLQIEDLASSSRNNRMSFGRACFYEKAKKKGISITRISKFIGLTHASVLNGLQKLPGYLLAYPEYKELYNEINNIKEIDKLPDAESKILHLSEKLEKTLHELNHYKSLAEELKKGKIKESHKSLYELIVNIPDYHVKTVEMRLKPIVHMLEKPSRYNNYLNTRVNA